MYDLNLVYYRYWSKCWYLSPKTALEAVGDENRPKFLKANFIPLKLTFLWLFYIVMGKIKCRLRLKKSRPKSQFLPLKSLWSGPKSLFSRRLFECPLAVQSASPQLWNVFTVKWASPGVRAAGKTNARHSVSSQLVKYNIIGLLYLWPSARKYTQKNSVKMVFVIYRVLCLTTHWPIPQV